MDRLFFIQDRELISSCIFMGRVDVFSGGLKTEKCHSKYGIRSGYLLIRWFCFGIFIGVLFLFVYGAFIL
jgi:hypothetical protein